MLLWIQQYCSKVKPVIIDGALYILIAVFGAIEGIINQDDAYKYWNVNTLYWTKFLVIVALAATGALKMFRSTTYSEHLETKQKEENEKITNSPFTG